MKTFQSTFAFLEEYKKKTMNQMLIMDMLTLVNLLHPTNALSLIVVTLLPIVTLVSEAQLENA